MKLRYVRRTGRILIVIGILFMIIGVNTSEAVQIFFGIAGLIINIIGLLVFQFFWKCPYCHMHLPSQGSVGMEFCPFCGNDLEL